MNFTTEEASTNSSNRELLNDLTLPVYIFHFLVGLPTHSYIIYHIVTGSGLAAEFFILNFAVCEIVNCLCSLFYVISNYSSCPVILATVLEGLCTTARPVFQCLMCVERFLAVVHPVTFLKLKPLRYRIFCCSVAWSFSCFSCVCYSIADKTSDGSIFKWLFSMEYTVFITIQLFCCVSVLLILKRSGPGERKEENHRKRRAFHIILIITVSMIITYIPYTVMAFISVLTKQDKYDNWVYALYFYFLAGFILPVLYLKNAVKPPCS